MGNIHIYAENDVTTNSLVFDGNFSIIFDDVKSCADIFNLFFNRISPICVAIHIV